MDPAAGSEAGARGPVASTWYELEDLTPFGYALERTNTQVGERQPRTRDEVAYCVRHEDLFPFAEGRDARRDDHGDSSDGASVEVDFSRVDTDARHQAEF